jgi:hypothetical protein
MKQSLRGLRNVTRNFAFVLAIACLSSLTANSPVMAQNHVMSYQGSLARSADVSSAPDGLYQLTVTLYADPQGVNAIWSDSYSTQVKGGIFNIQLGSGKALPDSKTMDQPIWLGVSINGTDELRPLTKLGAVSLAMNVTDQAITVKKLAPEVLGLLDKQNPQTAGDWSLTGNSSLTPGTDFLGTTDVSHLEMRVNNYRVMEYIDQFSSGQHEANDILGGWNGNTIGSGWANVIAGGGWKDILNSVNHPNRIGNVATSYYSFIGGGYDNQLNAVAGAVVGGRNNSVIGSYSMIGGGINNAIAMTSTPYAAEYSFVGGGDGNASRGHYAFVGGGYHNTAGTHSSVVGGNTNFASGEYSAVLGGLNNSAAGYRSSILGGAFLTLTGDNNVGFHAYDATSGAASISTSNTAYFGNVDLWLYNNDGIGHQLRFYEPLTGGGGTNYSSFRATDQITENIEYILPSTSVSALNKVLGITAQTGTTTLTNTLSWVDADAGAWKLIGNASTTSVTDGGTNYLGTTDNKAFEIRVYQTDASYKGSKRVLRFVPNAVSANIIGGYEGTTSAGHRGNTVVNGVAGGIVIGGGQDGDGISVDNNNKVTDHFGIIVGGIKNLAGDNDANYADAGFATIVGGENNNALSGYAFIGGGKNNTIEADDLTNSDNTNNYSIIGGGLHNYIYIDPFSLDGLGGWSAILGGKDNQAWERAAVVGGGEGNIAYEEYSIVGGGRDNQAYGEESSVVGGHSNYAFGIGGFIGGGYNNNNGMLAAIGGGANNLAAGYSSFIGGGGGDQDPQFGGTDWNQADATFAVITGGRANHVFGPYGVVGGGRGHNIEVGDPYDTTDFGYNTIGGGENNTIGKGAAPSTSNVNYATIPGGRNLVARSYGQTVVGVFNIEQGTSTTASNFKDATHKNDRLFIIGNGADAENKQNAFEVSNNGHSIVYDNNAAAANPALKGGRYIDNTPVAWGYVSAAGALLGGFGIQGVPVVSGVGSATYTITLNYTDPYTGQQCTTATNQSAVIATLMDNGDDYCSHITAKPVAWTGTPASNKIVIRTFYRTITQDPGTKIITQSCDEAPRAFMFAVFMRPQ